MDAYKSWVRSNREWISSMESLVNSLTWFLPERFAGSEMTPEAASTLLRLIAVMNQHIIETDRHPRGQRPGPNEVAESGPRRNDSSWALCISIMKEMELLIEMLSEQYLGKEKKWGPVASVETIKAGIRLVILHKNGYKMLLDGGESKHGEDVVAGKHEDFGFQQQQDHGNRFQNLDSHNSRSNREYPDQRSHPSDLESKARQAMLKFSQNAATSYGPSWLNQQRQPQERCSHNVGQDPSRSKSGGSVDRVLVTGELLIIMRPVIYVLLMWRYGRKSWRPWMAALSIDLAGMFLVSARTSSKRSMGLTTEQRATGVSISSEERQELRRRKLRWALYAMRSPFFERYTSHSVLALEKFMSPVPLLGMLSEKLVDLLHGIQGFYSYTSDS